jgi:hypothetical protein
MYLPLIFAGGRQSENIHVSLLDKQHFLVSRQRPEFIRHHTFQFICRFAYFVHCQNDVIARVPRNQFLCLPDLFIPANGFSCGRLAILYSYVTH